jgi:hypothetical protein
VVWDDHELENNYADETPSFVVEPGAPGAVPRLTVVHLDAPTLGYESAGRLAAQYLSTIVVSNTPCQVDSDSCSIERSQRGWTDHPLAVSGRCG